MPHEETEGRFTATPEKGEVSSVTIRPGDARLMLVLGHGAGTDCRHRNLRTIAGHCADAGVATFRYNGRRPGASPIRTMYLSPRAAGARCPCSSSPREGAACGPPIPRRRTWPRGCLVRGPGWR